MKIKDDSNNDLYPKKLLQLYNMIIVVRYSLLADNKHYQQVFSDECLYKL